MEGESVDNSKNEEVIPETGIPEIPIELPVAATEQLIDSITETAVQEKPTAKKKGRPKGAADRKPRPPRKKVVVQEELIEEEEEKENELPRPLPDSLPIPREATTNKAALMLELLQRQAMQRKNAKAQLWKSWFH